LAHVCRGVARRRNVEELVQEALALELVARVDEVVASKAEVRPRVEGVDRAVEVVARRALRLEEEVRGVAGHGRAVAEGVAREQPLVRDGVAEVLGRPLREDERAGEEAARAGVVGVVRGGQEGRAADVKLTQADARLVTPKLLARDGPRFDYAGR